MPNDAFFPSMYTTYDCQNCRKIMHITECYVQKFRKQATFNGEINTILSGEPNKKKRKKKTFDNYMGRQATLNSFCVCIGKS